jgi:hypothetical protein
LTSHTLRELQFSASGRVGDSRPMRIRFLLVLIAIIVAGVFLWRFNTSPVSPTSGVTRPSATEEVEWTRSEQGGTIAEEGSLTRAKRDFPRESESDLKRAMAQGVDLEKLERWGSKTDQLLPQLRIAMDLFKEKTGNYPQGQNSDVAKALLGENDFKVRFIEWPRTWLASDGTLLDGWGVPLYVDVQKTTVKLRSAGPNRTLWDEDDVVINR